MGDTSRYSYHSENNTTIYDGNSFYYLSDLRNGSGNTIGTSHRLIAAMQWNLDETKKLHIGLTWESKRTETNTDELIEATRSSSYTSSSNSNNYNYYDAGSERKRLLWKFNTSLTIVQIPVMFTYAASEVTDLIIGLNRTVSRWQIDDVTTALFDFRVRTSGSTTTTQTNFGERYTSARETITDVQSTVLFGLNLSPSRLFGVWFLFTPTLVEVPYGSSRTEFQWWLGLTLYP